MPGMDGTDGELFLPSCSSVIHRRDYRMVGSRFGNIFLTQSWTLFVDFVEQQHDAAMDRLGVDRMSVICSGCIRTVWKSDSDYVIDWRSSSALDRNEVSEEVLMGLYRTIERMVLPFNPDSVDDSVKYVFIRG